MNDRPPPSLIGGEPHLGELQSLVLSTPSGPIVEVGVYKGGSAWYLNKVAQERGDELHLFDTFTGIPVEEDGDTNHIGEFADTSFQDVLNAIPTAIFHVGLFPDTMPETLTSVSFVHCDCDQYYSVRAVIDKFWPIMKLGGVMAFDDMNTWGGQKAIRETFGEIGQEHGWWCVRKGVTHSIGAEWKGA